MINRIKDHFSFTKKELNGLIILCFLILLVASAPFIYSALNPPETYNFDDFKKEIADFKASAQREKEYSTHKNNYNNEKTVKAEYFPFNPNNLPEESWKRLGLKSWQIKMIKNYESKGGHFYRKEDFKKIYAIKPDDYIRLEPYIEIPEREYGDKFIKEKYSEKSDLKKKFVSIELNSADSSQLETLKGIGPAFASRIIKYRNRLGGFCRKEQLMEVYGLDSAKYIALQEQINLNSSSLQKINVNTATFDDLKKHPYLTYKQVNAIIQYRKQHGMYSSFLDLRKIVILSEDVLKKIEPYLSF